MNFGTKLRQLRKMHHLTQQQMSEKLNMEQSSYSRYETDKTVPTADIITRVADAFNVTPNWLMQSGNNPIIFENSSIGQKTADSIPGNQNQIMVPKEIIDTWLTQQKHLEILLKKLIDKLQISLLVILLPF